MRPKAKAARDNLIFASGWTVKKSHSQNDNNRWENGRTNKRNRRVVFASLHASELVCPAMMEFFALDPGRGTHLLAGIDATHGDPAT
jgi:hypothetical protein